MSARPVLLATVAAAWFVSLAGGWGDLWSAVTPGPGDDGVRRAAAGAGGALAVRARTLAGGDEFGLPTQLTVAGDELLVIDRYRDEPVLVLDRHSGEIVRAFGRAGEGPGEFASPTSVVVDGSSVAVLDPGLNRITWLESEEGSPAFRLDAVERIAFESVVTDFALTAGGNFLVTGFMPDSRLARLGRDGAGHEYVGPSPRVDGLTPNRRAEVFQGTLRASPARDRHVLTSRFASRIDIVDAATGEHATVWGPARFQPRSGDYETRFGYIDSAPTADGFFALYSGRTREDHPGSANYAATIHEFGWDGTLRAVYELDADVIAIAWSGKDALLYGARHDPVPAIVVYELDGTDAMD